MADGSERIKTIRNEGYQYIKNSDSFVRAH
jgi:hypothetical protein